ncbi:MAG: zinc ribbon domain-containing protein, partial [Thermoplasmata archaeon]|nr:zinc ribbon domain-containing protein [Thermoplasmata archaeon]
EKKVKTSEETIAKLEAMVKESKDALTELEKKTKKSENSFANQLAGSEDLQNTIDDLIKERDEFKAQAGKKSSKPMVISNYISKFSNHEAELKKEIKNTINNWNKLKGDLEKTSKKLDKGDEKALEEVSKKVEDLEKELTETEKKMKVKPKKDLAQLKKKKQSVEQQLNRARKKYEKLKDELKSSLGDPEKTNKIKDEIEVLIDKLAELQKEYHDLAKTVELDQITLYSILEALSRVTEKAPKNFEELLKQSLEREKKLETQLNVAGKNAEDLEKELDSIDKDYHSDIKQEFERLAKKEEEKYKKLLKKQDEKYKKELEIAAQTMFELKQYIEELEQVTPEGVEVQVPAQAISRTIIDPQMVSEPGAGSRVGAEEHSGFDHSSSPYTNVSRMAEEQKGKRGFPLKLPKNNEPLKPKSRGAKKKKKKQKKKRYEMCKCGSCGELIPIDAQSCPKCGAEFEIVDNELSLCGNCGETIRASVKSCPSCGAKFE